jgi:hypothetical protein
MTDDSEQRVPWIASIFRPGYKVARPTILALGRLLRGEASRDGAPPPPASEVASGEAIPLSAVPGLADIGGVAKIETEDHAELGIARVGRNSFVGFRLTDAELEEVAVDYDDQTGTLRISGASPQPPAS